MKPKIKNKIVFFTSIFAWIIVAGVVYWSGKSLVFYLNHETTNDAQVLEYINPVISRVGGYITEVKFNDFDQVKKGDTLLIIDSDEYRLDASQITSEVSKQNAMDRVLMQKKATLTDEALEAQQAIVAVKAKVWKEQLEYDRYKDLFDKKSATAQKLEEIKSNLEVYKSELATAQQHYKVAQSKIEDLSQERNVVKAEKNKLADLQERKNIDVGYTVITAPYDGRLSKRKIEKGQMINPGDPLLYIVNDENPKWVIANFKETQIKHIKLNDTVMVTADAFPDMKFKGKVISFSPATGSSFSLLPPDNATGNFVKIVQRIPVKIELFKNDKMPLNALISGMNVEVSIVHNN